jgi:phage terminase small subunit
MDHEEIITENLTPRQILFCQRYVLDFNGTQSYKEIYKDVDNLVAAASASRLLTNGNIIKYISKLKEDASNSLRITRESLLNLTKGLAYYDPRKFFNEDGSLKQIKELDEETAFALSSFEITEEKGGDGQGNQVTLGYTKKFKTSDRKAAIDILNKMLGYYAPEKVANTDSQGNDVKPSNIVILPPGSDNLEIKEDE